MMLRASAAVKDERGRGRAALRARSGARWRRWPRGGVG
jgi:hypothetical protein